MINEVDTALHGLLTEVILAATGTEVVFEPPSKDWAARCSAPTVDLFLYDIREDPARRQAGRIEQADGDGMVTSLRDPPRWYRLSYLVTAWTRLPQDEHRLLSALLAGLVGEPLLPASRLSGTLAELGLPVRLDVALPPMESRSLADLWSALGGELKPSLDLVVTAPLALPGAVAAPPVRDAVDVRLLDRGDGSFGAAAAVGARRTRGTPGAPRERPIRR
jgi:hypothetical protein